MLDWLQRRLQPRFVPPEVVGQTDRIGDLLPYETVLEDEVRPVVVLSDGGIGLVWKVELFAHEAMDLGRLEGRVETLSNALCRIVDPDAVLQVIYESRPAWRAEPVDWKGPAAAADVLIARQRAFQDLAGVARDRRRIQFRTMERSLFLTLRIDATLAPDEKTGLSARLSEQWLQGADQAIEQATRKFQASVRRLHGLAEGVENGADTAGLRMTSLDANEMLSLFRRDWHCEDDLLHRDSASAPYRSDIRLAHQVCQHKVRMARAGIELGGTDTIEVVSWLEQPRRGIRHGTWTCLLQLDKAFRMVVSLRPCAEMTDIKLAQAQLDLPTPTRSELRERHKEELRHIEQCVAEDEELHWVSIQLFIRNEGVTLEQLRDDGLGELWLPNWLERSTGDRGQGIKWTVESDAASAVHLLCQPLTYKAGTAWFTGRELRAPSSTVAAYLPVFGGFGGTPSHKGQLMHARAGNPIWLSARASTTAPHVAVLGSTGAGKSFFLANLLTAEAAAHDSMLFILDSLTSYRVLGEVLGEDGGFAFRQPPESFPNVWTGTLSNERLAILVGVLRAAMTLLDDTFRVTTEHDQLLEGAIRKAFADASLDSSTEFTDGLFADVDLAQVRLPRLTDVANALPQVAETLGLERETAAALRRKLSPYFGEGRYAAFFDAEEMAPREEKTPRVTLYDFGQMEDPTPRTLTLMICVAEIVREVMRPENRGRPGVMLIDEAGVLLNGSSPELEKFVRTAWKTFRKLNVSCIGSTNEPSDYQELRGPKSIWNNSPNKVLLPMKIDDLEQATLGNEAEGQPKLIKSPLTAALVGSLRKRPGEYSQGVWAAEETVGTFTYIPTGHDTWLAASRPLEVSVFLEVAETLGTRRAALDWLATNFPGGVPKGAPGNAVADEINAALAHKRRSS